MPYLDLFDEALTLVAQQFNAGLPLVILHTMIVLLSFNQAINVSDEAVLNCWREKPCWQFFNGLVYCEERPRCEATTLVNFYRLLGEEGGEELLAQTVNLISEKEALLLRWLYLNQCQAGALASSWARMLRNHAVDTIKEPVALLVAG